MKALCIILTSLLAINSWGCKIIINSAVGISDFPILAFINDMNGEIECRLHFRETGRFERLSGVGLTIQNEDETTSECLFHGYMELLDVANKDGVKTVVFYLQKDLIPNATVEVYSSKMTTNGLHGVSYELPLNLIHEHFKGNMTSGLPAGSTRSASTELIDDFLRKTFTADEDK